MINSSQTTINRVSIHHIGNYANQEEPKYSEAPLEIYDDKLHDLLRIYFLSNFTIPEFYSFTFPNEDLTLNPIYKFALEIFEDPEMLHENSIFIAKHLYEASRHPGIKGGDIYVAYMENVLVDDNQTDVVGIFKSENKDSYLKLKAYNNQFDLHADEGINIRKLDKGCLILNLEQEAGFKVLIVDNSNRSDAQFWKHDFLNLKPWSDAFHHTHNFMNLTRQYVAEQITDEFGVSKADQIDLLNRSVNFFKSKDHFNQAEFEVEVLGDPNVIESFRNYGKNFMSSNELDSVDNFEISSLAVKRQARIFKSVLKLDKNFHIYIHGNRELIEKGFDERLGKHYYKIYFDKEE